MGLMYVRECVFIHNCGNETHPRRQPTAHGTYYPAGRSLISGCVADTEDRARSSRRVESMKMGQVTTSHQSDDIKCVPSEDVPKARLIQLSKAWVNPQLL